ncbi:hypothetical protein PV08_10466 [Exophiala spinifera]|uniref:Zn(2)-C6 fungal-type domain-containing protein n=1 Tax=Exophiala spinifera TaxID=91928 RepID=A0A0D1Y862_9EURO|nr:uncharacterized protein PV08_10466 [Exophiala spinifera]KIW11166.1 hypothetical protein PV08_10466 [Exophiala spinifera]
MPPEVSTPSANPLKRPRQDPVSCQFCRSKKLKCDRQQPCSNCTTRGLPCNGQAQPRRENGSPSAEIDNLSILARLKRLEDIVMGSPKQDPAIPTDPLSGLPSRPSSTFACLSPPSEYEEAVHNLEEAGTRETHWPTLGASDIEFQILGTKEMASTPGVTQGVTSKRPNYQMPVKCVMLPPKEEADMLLEYYVKHVDDLQHVVFVSHLRTLMEKFYANLHQRLSIAYGQLALLLTVFASSAAMFSHVSCNKVAQFPPSSAAHASLVWANSALQVMGCPRRTAAGGLEEVQAAILMAFLLYHVEGFSARSRRLLAGALSTARDMGLHKLDATSGPSSNSLRAADPVDLEIQRRVWWHVVSTDWLLGLCGGPQEGTYFIHPRQFRVNLPLNINDSDLVYGRPLVGRPSSEPTTMSYYIQRIKLADICRSVIDVMPLFSVSVTSIDYQQIIELDGKFEAFLNDLPTFFKVDEKSRRESEAITRKNSYIKVQRYSLGMVARTRRCKLHQPFLIRRSVESHYTYSREISLTSARCVIQLRRMAEEEFDSTALAHAKMTGVVYHVFMATIVLVMDLCFNRSEGDDDKRKAEVTEACTILEEAAGQSSLAREFLDSLMDILRKHKVHLHPIHPEAASKTKIKQTPSQNAPSFAVPQAEVLHNFFPAQDTGRNYMSDFDSIWEDYIQLGPNMDMPEWDNLFADLDSRFTDSETVRRAPDLSHNVPGNGF